MKDAINKSGIKGVLTFDPDVIKTIAAIASLEIEGIYAISGGIFDGIAQKLSNKHLYKGIKVEIGSEEVSISLYLIVEYNHSIPDIYHNLKSNLQQSLEFMTGLKVQEVNVRIDGLKIYDDKEKEKEVTY
ncbi:hypothetical protein BHU72_03670 [Desulfuribacillus stibiiarsenatis]|uniref:Alkaline-shock protein n=1 Tax=Desulfuribacillus stibiiarsenatis TaxID=1390249 RepID=A0A1E5L739_9FIRM|nr:hypothetical protein BHU72_03670 [Desulfuribacillus stibiiarsenatis]